MAQRALAAIPVLVVLALSGCTAPPPAEPEPDPVSAFDTCTQVSSINTVLFNSGVAFSEGRFSEQEVSGAQQLAFSMASYVQVDPDSALAPEIASLKLVPAEGIPTLYGPQSSSSEEWDSIVGDLAETCKDLGAEIYVTAWTGG